MRYKHEGRESTQVEKTLVTHYWKPYEEDPFSSVFIANAVKMSSVLSPVIKQNNK